jgi:FtsP/CotA-like multicopper oxidase with cupredoxin domain
MSTSHDHFPTATTGLVEADRPEEVQLAHGEHYELRITPVVKHIAGSDVRMLAYNGSIPGPTLRVKQGSEIEVEV